MFNHLIPGHYAIWNKTWTESDVVVTQAVRSGTHSKFSRVIESVSGLARARPNIRLPTVPQCPILTSVGVRELVGGASMCHSC